MSSGNIRIVVSGQNSTGPTIREAARSMEDFFRDIKAHAAQSGVDLTTIGRQTGQGMGGQLSHEAKAKSDAFFRDLKAHADRMGVDLIAAGRVAGHGLGSALEGAAKHEVDKLTLDFQQEAARLSAQAMVMGVRVGRDFGNGVQEAAAREAHKLSQAQELDRLKAEAARMGAIIGEDLGSKIAKEAADAAKKFNAEELRRLKEFEEQAKLAGKAAGDALGDAFRRNANQRADLFYHQQRLNMIRITEEARITGNKMGRNMGDGVNDGFKGKMQRLLNMFQNAGSDAGKSFGSGFSPTMMQVIIAAVIAMLPILGAALNSLILLAVGGMVGTLGAVSAFKQSSAVSGDFSKEIAAKRKAVSGWSSKLAGSEAALTKWKTLGGTEKQHRSILYDIALDTASLHKAQAQLHKLTTQPAEGFAKVKARAKELFGEMGKPFISPMVTVMNTLADTMTKIKQPMSEMARIFAPMMTQLGKGLGGMLTGMMPGMLAALKASMPLFHDLATALPAIGEALGGMFKNAAGHGREAKVFFRDFLTLLIGAINALSNFIGWLATVYLKFREMSAFLIEAWQNVMSYMLNSTGDLIHGLAKAFGWLPNGIGASLIAADEKFSGFRTNVENHMQSIHDSITNNLHDVPAVAQDSANAIESAFKGIKIPKFVAEVSTSAAMAAVRKLNAGILSIKAVVVSSANAAERGMRRIATSGIASANAIEHAFKHSSTEAVHSVNAVEDALIHLAHGASQSANAAEEALRRVALAGENSANAIEHAMGRAAMATPPKAQTRVFQAHGGLGQGGMAHGGILGAAARAAAGGLRNGRTLVGEYGPEYADLPPGTMVHPAGTTANMLGSGGGGGGSAHITVDVRGSNDDFAVFLRKMVKIYGGGSVQAAFGTGA